MVTGPYQSTVLRFALRQYRKVRARHRRVMRQARSTVALGAAVGVGLIVLPVSAVAKASQKVGLRLKQATANSQTDSRVVGRGLPSKVARYLDFSGFSALPAWADRAQADETLPVAVAAEVPLAQTLLAVGACLLPSQLKLLSTAVPVTEARPAAGTRDEMTLLLPPEQTLVEQTQLVSQSQSLGQRFMMWRQRLAGRLSRWLPEARQRSVSAESPASDRSITGVAGQMYPTVSDLPLAQRAGAPMAAQKTTDRTAIAKVTGVASDLETRSLVLVVGCTAIWRGLTADQQVHLQVQISRFLGEAGLVPNCGNTAGLRSPRFSSLRAPVLPADTQCQLARSVACSVSSVKQPQKAGLVHTVRSFWVDVLSVVMALRERPATADEHVDRLSGLPHGAARLEPSRLPGWLDGLNRSNRRLLRLPAGATKVGDTIDLGQLSGADARQRAQSTPAAIAEGQESRWRSLVKGWQMNWRALLGLVRAPQATETAPLSLPENTVAGEEASIETKTASLSIVSSALTRLNIVMADWAQPGLFKPDETDLASNSTAIQRSTLGALKMLPWKNALAVPMVADEGVTAVTRTGETGVEPADPLLEANVVAVAYVAHPLEKLLKWVDRLLFWLETRWQLLVRWWLQRLGVLKRTNDSEQ